MISQISDWVVDAGIPAGQRGATRGCEVGVALNLPPILWQPSMADHLRSSVSAAGLRPNEFMIEVTESAIMTNPDRSQRDPAGASRDGIASRSTTSAPATPRSPG